VFRTQQKCAEKVGARGQTRRKALLRSVTLSPLRLLQYRTRGQGWRREPRKEACARQRRPQILGRAVAGIHTTIADMYAVVVVTEENRTANKMLQANCEMTPEHGSDWLLVSFVLVGCPGRNIAIRQPQWPRQDKKSVVVLTHAVNQFVLSSVNRKNSLRADSPVSVPRTSRELGRDRRSSTAMRNVKKEFLGEHNLREPIASRKFLRY
jgi:hypothetical protein